MIVLASKSPRRKEILKDLGYDFIVCPAKKDEVFDLSLGLDEALKKVAESKAKEVREFFSVETTDVYFKKLTEQDIISYVNSGKCMDKAGSYGIQECDFVDHIEGDYTNVVGLPKYVVESIMKDVAL